MSFKQVFSSKFLNYFFGLIFLWACSGGSDSPTESQEPAPVSNFTATPTILIQGQAVTFTSTSTGTITSYAWNVDDDPAIEGTTATYSHTYTEVGTYSITLTVTGPGGSNPKTVADMINVSTAAPTPTTETSQTVQEDGSTTIGLTATDPNGQAVTFAITTDPTNGTATLSGTEITYTPNANFYGTDSFDYTASNGTYTSDPATITITVEGEDDGNPTTNDVSATTDEDTVVTVNLDATEIDGDNYSFSIISQPSNGTLGSINGNQVEYTPNQDWNGTDTFTFEATDDRTSRRNVATATITVNAVNDAPVANDITSQVTDENRAMQLDITLDATDVEGDALTYSIIGTNNGTVTVNGSTATYTPNQDWNGEDTFTYKANDGNLDSNTATVTVTVNAVNDAPVTQNVSFTTDEDTPYTESYTSYVSDVDGDNLTIIAVTNPTNGTAACDGTDCTYTPNQDFNGTDSFTYKVNDGELDSNVSTVTVTVTAVNDAPVANDMTATMDENKIAGRYQPVTIFLNATDVDGDDLTYSVVGSPTNGTLGSINGNQIIYTPTQDYYGEDTFTYKANDGTVDSNTATVTVTVNAINDAPVSNDITFSLTEDTSTQINLDANDVDGDVLSYSILSLASNGTLSASAEGIATYTPSINWNGTDTFTYKANDGELDSNTATVTINVTPVNDPPVAKNITASTNENRSMQLDITLDATDVEGDALTYSIVGINNGTVTVNGSTATYTPKQDWNGEDTFTYKANDGELDSNTATVTVTVNAVNDAPVTEDQSASTDEDTAVDVTLTATDVENDNLTYTIVSDVSNGTTALSGTTVTYTPTANFNGTDTFTFKANDGTDDSNTSTVTITVASVNDAPTTSAVSVSTNEDTAKAITLVGADIDTGDTLTYSIVSNPSNGTLGSVSGTSVTYTPTANWNGTDTFTFKANDGTVDSNTSTVTITVAAVNDAPVATDVDDSTVDPQDNFPHWGSMNTPLNITLTATDVENDNLTYTIVTAPDSGSVTINGSVATYTPNNDFVPGFTNEGKQNAGAADTFTYKANDGSVDSNVATVGTIGLGGTNILFPNRDYVHNGSNSNEQKNITKGTNVASGIRFWSNMGGIDVDWEIGLYDSNKNLIQAIKTIDAGNEDDWSNQGFSRDGTNPKEYRLSNVQFNTAGDEMFLGIVTTIPSGTNHPPSFTEYSDEPFGVYHIAWNNTGNRMIIRDPNFILPTGHTGNEFKWVKGARYRDVGHYRAGGDAWDFDLYKGSTKVQDLDTTSDTDNIDFELLDHSAGDDYFVRVSDDSGNILRDSANISIVDAVTYTVPTANQEFVIETTMRVEMNGYFINPGYQVWRVDLENTPDNEPLLIYPNNFINSVNDTTKYNSGNSFSNMENGYLDIYLQEGCSCPQGNSSIGSGMFKHQGEYRIKIIDNDDTTNERKNNTHWSPTFKVKNP